MAETLRSDSSSSTVVEGVPSVPPTQRVYVLEARVRVLTGWRQFWLLDVLRVSHLRQQLSCQLQKQVAYTVPVVLELVR